MPEIMQFAHGVLTIGGVAINKPVAAHDPSPEQMPDNPFKVPSKAKGADKAAADKAAADKAASEKTE